MSLHYVLSSNFPKAGNEQLARLLSDAGVVGPVGWMAPEPNAERFARAQAEFDLMGFGALVDISRDGAHGIRNVVAVYLSGGNPLAFRDRLQESGMSAWLRSNHDSSAPLPVVAASGGAMQLTRSLSLFRLLSVPVEEVLLERRALEGLSLTPCEVVPHIDHQPVHLVDAARAYARRVDRPVWGIPDGSAITVFDSVVVPFGAATLL